MQSKIGNDWADNGVETIETIPTDTVKVGGDVPWLVTTRATCRENKESAVGGPLSVFDTLAVVVI